MPRGRGYPVRGRSTKKHVDWSGSVPLTAMVALAGSSQVLDQIFTPFAEGETVVRTRGLFTWGSDQFVAGEDQLGAVGIGIVSAQAASVGITAVPHPDTDSAWDGWLWHSYFASRITVGDQTAYAPAQVHQLRIDSKAMRKVGSDERAVLVVQNSSASGMIFSLQVRFLSKVW